MRINDCLRLIKRYPVKVYCVVYILVYVCVHCDVKHPIDEVISV